MNETSLSEGDIQDRLEKKIAFIDEAIENIRRDSLTDIQELEQDIETFCQALAALPPEEAAEYEPDMARLIARLDVLAEELQSFQDRAEEALAEDSKQSGRTETDAES